MAMAHLSLTSDRFAGASPMVAQEMSLMGARATEGGSRSGYIFALGDDFTWENTSREQVIKIFV
jgi:hypothetical protein